MIKEADLLDAIAECQGDRNPNANTCIKLAAYYTILENIRKPDQEQSYSYASGEHYNSNSEFSNAIQGLSMGEIMPVMDELMESIQVLFPKMYKATILRLRDL